MNTQDTNELKRGGGYLKEKALVGLSHVTGDELDRAIIKVTSHMLKAPKEKHMQRLLAATYGHHKSSAKRGKSISDYIVSELEKRSHTHNWIVVLKTMVTLHRLMTDGSDEINNALQRSRNIFCARNIKDLSETVEGVQQGVFIREYMQYLEERALCQLSLGINNRMESTEFSVFLRSLDVDSLTPVFEILLAQLKALSEVKYRESIVDNFCTLEAYQKLVDDGKILYQLLSNRVIFILGGFSDFAVPLKKRWLEVYCSYTVVSERLRLFFNGILDSSKIFPYPPPRLKPLPSSLLEHLENDVRLSGIPKENATETLESLGIVPLTVEENPTETITGKRSPSLPPNSPQEETPWQEKEQSTLLLTQPDQKLPLLSIDDLFVSPPSSSVPLAQSAGLDMYLPIHQDSMTVLGAQYSSSCPVQNASNNIPGLNAANTDYPFSSDKAMDSGWSSGAPPAWQTAPSVDHLYSPPSSPLPNNNWGNIYSIPEGTRGKNSEDVFKDLYTDEKKGWYSKN